MSAGLGVVRLRTGADIPEPAFATTTLAATEGDDAGMRRVSPLAEVPR